MIFRVRSCGCVEREGVELPVPRSERIEVERSCGRRARDEPAVRGPVACDRRTYADCGALPLGLVGAAVSMIAGLTTARLTTADLT